MLFKAVYDFGLMFFGKSGNVEELFLSFFVCVLLFVGACYFGSSGLSSLFVRKGI